MRDAVIDAVTRYGTQFSSSRAYLSSPQYNELEPLLDEMFGGHVLVDADDVARPPGDAAGARRVHATP